MKGLNFFSGNKSESSEEEKTDPRPKVSERKMDKSGASNMGKSKKTRFPDQNNDDSDEDAMMEKSKYDSRRSERKSETPGGRPSIRKSEPFNPDESGFERQYKDGTTAGQGSDQADCQGCSTF